MQIKTILVPYDFSEHAEHAFEWALELATSWQAEIVLLHATASISHVVHAELAWETDKIEAELVAEAEKRLQGLAEKTRKQGVGIKTRALRGEPFSEICQAAGQYQADLIVMGSRGRTGLAHVFLGSVAERVVRQAACPVLVVRR